jgi:hypothetical protein
VHNLAPEIPVTGMKTLERQLDESLVTERMVATLSSVFGALATLLAIDAACDHRALRRDGIHGDAAIARDQHPHGVGALPATWYGSSCAKCWFSWASASPWIARGFRRDAPGLKPFVRRERE